MNPNDDCISSDLTEEEKQTAKGVKKAVKKAFLRHVMYKETLDNLSSFVVTQNVIKSKAHTIGTYHQNKTALTAFDTKRWICDNGVETRAFGHVNNNVNK